MSLTSRTNKKTKESARSLADKWDEEETQRNRLVFPHLRRLIKGKWEVDLQLIFLAKVIMKRRASPSPFSKAHRERLSQHSEGTFVL